MTVDSLHLVAVITAVGLAAAAAAFNWRAARASRCAAEAAAAAAEATRFADIIREYASEAMFEALERLGSFKRAHDRDASAAEERWRAALADSHDELHEKACKLDVARRTLEQFLLRIEWLHRTRGIRSEQVRLLGELGAIRLISVLHVLDRIRHGGSPGTMKSLERLRQLTGAPSPAPFYYSPPEYKRWPGDLGPTIQATG